MAQKRTPQERQFSLVLALKVTKSGLTKAQILESVNGYTNLQGDQAAIDRMFERDKEALRDSGIPIQTVPDLFEPENNQLTKYVITDADYAIPDDFELTTPEAQMVQLASALWTLGTDTSTTSNLLAKLTAKGVAFNPQDVQIASFTDAISPLASEVTSAISASRGLSFDYKKQGAQESENRRIAPIALVNFQHRLVVWGWDLTRKDYRSFLIERITAMGKSFKLENQPFDRSNGQVRALKHLSKASTEAQLRVAEGTTAQVQLAKQAIDVTGDVYTIEYVDRVLCSDYLASFGAEIEVLAPAELRTQHISTLANIIAAHSAPAPELPVAVDTDAPKLSKRKTKSSGVDSFVLLLALVPYLLRNPYVNASKAAADFSTTTKEIKAAVSLIGVSGVPGESQMYLPQDLFEIDSLEWEQHNNILLTNHVAIDKAPALSNTEVTSILVSLQVLASVLTDKDAEIAHSAAAKLAAGRDAIPLPSAGELSTERKQLAEAIAGQHRVKLSYVAADGNRTIRLFDPVETYFAGSYWYARGVSYSEAGSLQGERSLRIDRIAGLEVTNDKVSLANIGNINVSRADSAQHVIELDGNTRRDLHIAGIAAYVRDVASSGGQRVVVSPNDLRLQVLQWAQHARANYSEV